MDAILISDLEVAYRVGVPESERRAPQRLLISIEMQTDFSKASEADDIAHTIDYFALSQRILGFGKNREWKLIEKLADDLARMILSDFRPRAVSVLVKKFPIPQAQSVAVRVTRDQAWLKDRTP
jgi:7,8-dihydroneopterin aldolase/epimerase/oxygenase